MTQEREGTYSFEEALRRLEEVQAKLEKNDCPLEEAIKLFDEGMRLVKFCRQRLADAEEKISILIKETGDFAPFNPEKEN